MKKRGKRFCSINDIKGFHRGHWFDADTMRFFKSKVYDWTLCHNSGTGLYYFVSSEKNDGNGYNNPRMYSIRSYNPETDTFDTVSEFQAYKTLRTAEKHCAKLAG